MNHKTTTKKLPPDQDFQSRKLTKTIQTAHMTDFNPLRVHLFLFPLPQNIHTRTAYSAANLPGALNEQMPAGLLSLA